MQNFNACNDFDALGRFLPSLVAGEVAEAVFVAMLIKGEIDAPELLLKINLYAPDHALRPRNFLIKIDRARTYRGAHYPIISMCKAFNKFYCFFDFNITVDTFKCSCLYSNI